MQLRILSKGLVEATIYFGIDLCNIHETLKRWKKSFLIDSSMRTPVGIGETFVVRMDAAWPQQRAINSEVMQAPKSRDDST
jgi:hypothetical protein